MVRHQSRSAAALAVAGLLLTGCGAVVPGTPTVAQVLAGDLALIHAYIDGLNAAGQVGVDAQTTYLRATQDPSTPFPRSGCLGQVTLETHLVDRTVRPDPDFTAPQAGGALARPGGAVYVVATDVSASQDGVMVREQIGSKHVVIRAGRVYGYSPCPE